jgi:MFS family permease
VPLPILLLKDRPQSMGLLPDGDLLPRNLVTESIRDQGMSWSNARGDAAFWSMTSAFCLVMAGLQGSLVHMPAMLVDRGSTAEIGALAASCIGAALLAGRVGTGYLLDRFFAPYVAAFLFGQGALGMLLLALHGPNWLAFISATSVGLAVGAEADLMAYMISRYFGLRSFAEIYSYSWAAFVISIAIGPYLMGLGFDKTGSYRVPLLAFVLAAAAAAILMARIGPYRFGPQRAASAALEAQAEIVNL